MENFKNQTESGVKELSLEEALENLKNKQRKQALAEIEEKKLWLKGLMEKSAK